MKYIEESSVPYHNRSDSEVFIHNLKDIIMDLNKPIEEENLERQFSDSDMELEMKVSPVLENGRKNTHYTNKYEFPNSVHNIPMPFSVGNTSQTIKNSKCENPSCKILK